MVRLSKGAKYIAANVGLVACIFLALQYFDRANGPHPQSAQAGLLAGGIILYLFASTAIIMRAYYRGQRFQFLDMSPRETAARAEALLGAERLQPVTLTLQVDDAVYQTLVRTASVTLKPEIFKTPIRYGDRVHVRTSDAVSSAYAIATIAEVDGYNQTVTLKLAS